MSQTEDAPIIQLVSHLLRKAHESRASDLHLEPFEKGVRVRFRIDGLLHEAQLLPKATQEALVNRLKILTDSIDVAEKRLPQEGRFQTKLGNQVIDVRVSIIPSIHGESVVLRLLDRSASLLTLTELGLESACVQFFKKTLCQTEGLVLITGPTGSGKTTTLYACLNQINQPQYKIITVEDPIEYNLPGINQVQIHEKIGRTFPIVLRAILRQATNKMMIGEIRDQKTATIAMNASLTGHLVLSSLHANNAISTIARLQDLTISPFLIATSLRAIIAQRLVRRLCSFCKVPTTMTSYEQEIFQIDSKIEGTPMKAIGCEKCTGNGFQGRIGIFEILSLNTSFRKLIHQKASLSDFEKQARAQGMKTLREDGLQKIMTGLTTAEEVIAATLI